MGPNSDDGNILDPGCPLEGVEKGQCIGRRQRGGGIHGRQHYIAVATLVAANRRQMGLDDRPGAR